MKPVPGVEGFEVGLLLQDPDESGGRRDLHGRRRQRPTHEAAERPSPDPLLVDHGGGKADSIGVGRHAGNGQDEGLKSHLCGD